MIEKPLWRVEIERILNEKAFQEAIKVPRTEWDRFDSCWDQLEDPPEEWSNLFGELIGRAYQQLSLQEALNLVFHMGQVWEIYKSTTRTMERPLAIGEVARQLELSVDWLRITEKAGKIPKAKRTPSGRRVYTQEDVERLRQLLLPIRQQKNWTPGQKLAVAIDERLPDNPPAVNENGFWGAVEQLLTERQALILKYRFGRMTGEAQSLEMVGRRVSLTRERIRQIEAGALEKLRHRRHLLTRYVTV